MGILLTEEEIRQAEHESYLKGKWQDDDGVLESKPRYIAKAQVKKVVEWGDEECPHPSTFDGQLLGKKRNCPECWREILKGIE